jgi:hypothetical protein
MLDLEARVSALEASVAAMLHEQQRIGRAQELRDTADAAAALLLLSQGSPCRPPAALAPSAPARELRGCPPS